MIPLRVFVLFPVLVILLGFVIEAFNRYVIRGDFE